LDEISLEKIMMHTHKMGRVERGVMWGILGVVVGVGCVVGVVVVVERTMWKQKRL
jgi:hypothetical protein